MKIGDVRNKDNNILQMNLEDLRSELFNIKTQLSTGHLADTANIRKVKRDVARILTVIRERENEAAKQGK